MRIFCKRKVSKTEVMSTEINVSKFEMCQKIFLVVFVSTPIPNLTKIGHIIFKVIPLNCIAHPCCA